MKELEQPSKYSMIFYFSSKWVSNPQRRELFIIHVHSPGKCKGLEPIWKQFFSSKKVFVVSCLLQVGREGCLTQLFSPSEKAMHHCTRAVRHPSRRKVSDASSDPMEAELLQLKQQLCTYCTCLKNLFLSGSHYKNQSCHTSPEYEVNKDSTNTLVTKDDGDRFHFLQTADMKSQHLGTANRVGRSLPL